MLPASSFHRVYTWATRQNHRGEAGRFCFFLAKGWKARSSAATTRAIQVEARDTAGNAVVVEAVAATARI
jgi:hypothetical protein